MSAGRYDLIIEKGADFTRTFKWKDDSGAVIPLTGYSARMKIRAEPFATAELFSADSTGPSSPLTVDEAGGAIGLTITAAATDGLSFSSGYYDLEIQAPTGAVKRLLQGAVSVIPSITH